MQDKHTQVSFDFVLRVTKDEPIIIVQILTQLGCNLGLNLGIFYESGEEGANFDVKTQNKFFLHQRLIKLRNTCILR